MRIRLMGSADEVDLVLEVLGLSPLVRVEDVSRPYPCRQSSDIRVYVTVWPASRLVEGVAR